MPKTTAVLVHVDRVDPAAYDGTWSGVLNGPRNDVIVMGRVLTAAHQGDPDFVLRYLPSAGHQVTRAMLGEWLEWAATELVDPGDMLVFHFSGHGGTIPNAVGGLPPRLNTLCLHDGMFLDAELGTAWSRFRPGVLIVLIVDACYSGSIAHFRAGRVRAAKKRKALIERVIPRQVADDAYRLHKDFYDTLELENEQAPRIAATVLQFAACTDEQKSYEDPGLQPSMGVFTSNLVSLLESAPAPTSYRDLHARVRSRVSDRAQALGVTQEPVLLQIGADIPGLFERRPFSQG